VPVVSTAVGGVPDLLKGGAWGRLVRPGAAGDLAEALLTTLNEEPGDYLDEARAFVLSHYDPDSLAGAVADLYNKLCAESPAGAENGHANTG